MKRCMGCMKEYGEQHSRCPACGYSEEQMHGEGTAFSEALETGSVLEGRFIIGRPLSCSDFSFTYIGWDTLLRRRVAIKEYFPYELASRSEDGKIYTTKPEELKLFEEGADFFTREVEILNRNQDIEEIVHVYKMIKENGTYYMVMEYMKGCTLLDHMEAGLENCGISSDEILAAVMGAVNKIHSRGIGHFNLSPDNIYIDEEGKIRLLDFGEAKEKLYKLSKGKISGYQEEYIAPEILHCKENINLNADLYSIGILGYELYFGKIPKRGRPWQRNVNKVNSRKVSLLRLFMDPDPRKRPDTLNVMWNPSGGQNTRRQ